MLKIAARAAVCALMILALSPATFGQDKAASTIKDDGDMFGANALERARAALSVGGATPVVIETIKSTQNAEIDGLASRRHRQKYAHAVYILMASRERKTSKLFAPETMADLVSEKDQQAVREAFLEGFKRKDFDAGLMGVVSAIMKLLGPEGDRRSPIDDKARDGAGRGVLVERNQARLTLEGARVALAAAEAKARELRVRENIAVVDEGGHLLAFARMDGARPASVATATTKAVTAATFRQPTGPLPVGAEKPDPLLNVSMQLAALQSDGKFTVLLGGIPITLDGQVVGAVGVGGGSGEQDAEVARAAVAALEGELKAVPVAKPTPEPVEKPRADGEPEKKADNPFDALREGSKPEKPE